MENFYLIESSKINELNKAEKDFLEKQLTTYHTHSSSVIDKVEAIYALVDNIDLKKFRFEYNAWLYDFVKHQLKIVTTEKEVQYLEKILASCYDLFGKKNDYAGNFQKALESFKEALKIRKETSDSTSLFKNYYNIALMYHKNGDLSNTIKFYEKCTELSREIEDKTIVAHLYNSLSLTLRERRNFPKYLDYLYKALSIYEENNDVRGMALCYKNIGLSLIEQLELDEALNYFFAALKLSKKVGDKTRQAVSYVRIGSIYQEKGENDTALKYYLKAENLPTTFDLPLYAFLKIGTLYESKNRLDVAINYYNKSLKQSKEKGYKRVLSETLSKIGVLEIKKGNIEEASEHIESAFMLAQELNSPQMTYEAAAAKVHLAIEKGNYKLAYEMEKLKNEMKEKIQNKENTKAVIKHQLKYECEKQLKQKNIEIEEERLNNQHLKEQINILLAKNKLLTSKNKITIEQVITKDGLTQELLGNNNGLSNSA